ncbi:hypothetical protein GJ744_000161 [Endocarpon pusillum]|uniref:Uncharacterized protein n=1 Tax=Endocarpon pusillum TaxID=364733 RepID=A0A8H7EC37_9EURO|nr:hypothetical protein GJ744_000161 [Endocarpon pusillum]
MQREFVKTASTASPPIPSASFFSPIDPYLRSRQSTFHLPPQYVFPSHLNYLPRNFEVPYAFNHNTLSFYWTRADALADVKYNICARAPCLNCVVACGGDEDGDLARRCDLSVKMDESFGKVRTCGRCVRNGEGGRCVEMIEVRRDGSVSAQVGDFDTKEFGGCMWSERERRLRRNGVVEWRPVNLHVGEVEGKEEVVRAWTRLRECGPLFAGRQNWALPRRTPLAHRATEVVRVRREMIRDIESAEGKQARLKRAAAQVEEWDREDELLDIQTSDLESSAPEGQKIADDKHFEATRATIEHMLDRISGLEIYIAEQKRFWHDRICAQSVHLYDKELTQSGVQAAVEIEKEWKKAKSLVISEVEDLLDHVLRGRAEGVDETDILAWVEKVSADTREWLDRLVPRIWDRLAIHMGER